MGMKALCVVITFLFANFAFAQSFYTTCTPLPSSPTAADINAYNTCVANNRASAQSSGTAAAQSFTLNGSTVVAPTSGSAEQNNIYNQNTIINSAAPTALTTEQLTAVSVTATGAAAALGQSMRANTEGETTYLVTSEGTLAEGLGKLSLAGECASVSSSGCYNQRSELYATGAAYLLAQRQAQDQAGQHQNARTIACNAKNQISSDQENCGSALDNALAGLNGSVLTSMSGITVTVGPAVTSAPLSTIVYDALTGACSPPTAPACVNLSRNVVPLSTQMQQTVREILKQRYGKTGSVTATAQSLYSINKDGSISVKGDGIYSPMDFLDSKKMKAKGLSDTFAQNLTKNVASWMTATASSAMPAVAGTSGLDIAESPFTIAALEMQKSMTAPSAGQSTEDANADREPASLRKQLGSEFIGVAKDDIFKIINRRYKSEEKEDFFY